jgi:hypothetical protein
VDRFRVTVPQVQSLVGIPQDLERRSTASQSINDLLELQKPQVDTSTLSAVEDPSPSTPSPVFSHNNELSKSKLQNHPNSRPRESSKPAAGEVTIESATKFETLGGKIWPLATRLEKWEVRLLALLYDRNADSQ